MGEQLIKQLGASNNEDETINLSKWLRHKNQMNQQNKT